MQKSSENSIQLPKNRRKKTKIFYSVMASMTIFIPNKNPSNFVII